MRSAEKAKVLEALHPHIKVVSGNISGPEITALAENAHIVVEMVSPFNRVTDVFLIHATECQANSDDVALIEAILSGLRKRHEATGDVPLFFHTVSPLGRTQSVVANSTANHSPEPVRICVPVRNALYTH